MLVQVRLRLPSRLKLTIVSSRPSPSFALRHLAAASSTHDLHLSRREAACARIDSFFGDTVAAKEGQVRYRSQLHLSCEAWRALQSCPPLYLLALSDLILKNEPMKAPLHPPSSPTSAERDLLLHDISLSVIGTTITAQRSGRTLASLSVCSSKLTLVANAVLYRLFLPLLHLLPAIKVAFEDFEHPYTDVLSSSSLFASRILNYSHPSAQDPFPYTRQHIEADPAFQTFVTAFVPVLISARHLEIDEETFAEQHRAMCELVDVEEDEQAKKSEEKLQEAILDADLCWRATRRHQARKEQ
jgi:Fe-S-cluster formation regulator IscX/YfhJ